MDLDPVLLQAVTSRRNSPASESPTSAPVSVSEVAKSAAGTTSSSRHPFVVPTSMYSMKRSVCPVPRK